MSEALTPHTFPENMYVDLPSRERIVKNLGLVSTSNSFKENFVPGFSKLADSNDPVSVGEFVNTLAHRLEEYADNSMMGITALAQKQGSRIIELVINDPEQNESVTAAWDAIPHTQAKENISQLRRERPASERKGRSPSRANRRVKYIQSSRRTANQIPGAN